MAMNCQSVTGETLYVLGVSTHTSFVQINHICCVRLYLSPCKAEHASPALGHN